MRESVLYIKAEKDTIVTHKKIYLEDIMTMYSTDSALTKELGQTVVMMVQGEKRQKYVLSILKIISLIGKEHPGLMIENLGESDIIVEYVPPGHKSRVWEWVNAALVCITVFIGSAFTIMTFNEDVSVVKVFQLIHDLVAGPGEEKEGILEIAYAVGMPVGIIIFYNHFSKLKIDSDPTPLQVQLRLYEGQVNDTVIENASREGRESES